MKPKYYYVMMAVIALKVTSFFADADDQTEVKKDLIVTPSPVQKKDSKPSDRVALVIGNADYDEGALQNPVNDAVDMGEILKSLGFDVIVGTNLNQQQMYYFIREFGDKLRNSKIGLFYFSGHGVKIADKNYLLPIKMDIKREDEVHFQAIEAELVLNKMKTAGNPMNIVILDACRNNPFAKSWSRGIEDQGLAKMGSIIPPNGLLIFYATKPGNIALDGNDKNSPFTKSLKKHMMEPGLDIRILPSMVANDVIKETKDKQQPWIEGMILNEFSFRPLGTGLPQQESLPAQKPDVTPALPAPPVMVADKGAALTDSQNTSPEDLTLKIICNVDSPTIWINGVNEGNPDLFKLPKAGSYKIKVTADGYQPYQTIVPIAEGRSIELKVYLEKAADSTSLAEQQKQFVNTYGMVFVYIEPGTFMMGSPEDELGREIDETLYQVTLTKGFYLQTTELTQGQWKAVTGSLPEDLYFKTCGDNCPIERVSWIDVRDFIMVLNEKENTNTYRLPTEAEWEYAARAGTTTPFAFGNCLSTDQANFNGSIQTGSCPAGRNRKKLVPVESFMPNAWGLYDMHGNVGEWCQDLKGDYPTEPASDPLGFSACLLRTIRGGNWGNEAAGCRSAARFSSLPTYRGNIVGFRLAKSP